MSKTLYDKRKEQGLCVKCGDKAREGKTTCRSCLDRDIQHNKERKEKLKLLGLCITCGHRQAEPHRVRCFECCEKSRIYAENRRKQADVKQSIKKSDKARYETNKTQGICTHCGKKPKEKGLVCISCYNKKRANQRRYDDRNGIARGISRAERVSYGLCYVCGEKAITGRSVCENHYKQREESIKRICYMPVSETWKQENDVMYGKRVGVANVKTS